MVEVSRVSDDAFVLFVERVHRPPRERHPSIQHGGIIRKRGVLPGRMVGLTSIDADGEPSRIAEIAMLGDALF